MHRQSHMSLCANPTFLRFNLATKRLPSARRPSPNLTFLGFNLATKRLPSRRQRCRCGCLFTLSLTLSYLLGRGIYLFIYLLLCNFFLRPPPKVSYKHILCIFWIFAKKRACLWGDYGGYGEFGATKCTI
jgi:hypothetical protein